MNKNSRGFAPLIIVIVLALIGLAGYIVFRSTTITSPTFTPNRSSTPTPDETTNWKTYSSEEVGISFEYPPDLTEGNLIKGEDGAFATSLKNDIYTIFIMSGLSKSEGYESTREGFEQFIDDVATKGPNGKRLVVDGQPAAQSSVEYGQTKITSANIISKSYDSTVFLSLQTTNAKEATDFEMILEHILSTFKFLVDDSQTKQPITGEECVVGGCNSELCQDADEEPLASICLYKPDYACYKSATCERRTDGRCGWTPTAELLACLDEYNSR